MEDVEGVVAADGLVVDEDLGDGAGGGVALLDFGITIRVVGDVDFLEGGAQTGEQHFGFGAVGTVVFAIYFNFGGKFGLDWGSGGGHGGVFPLGWADADCKRCDSGLQGPCGVGAGVGKRAGADVETAGDFGV